ncbi:MAG: hypothetical protein ABSG93_16985, partial [Solirubrobacteraceae bacterium]
MRRSLYQGGKRDMPRWVVALILAVAAGALIAVRTTASGPGAERVSCSVTVSPGVGVGVIASDVVSAADGATVCLAGGSYPAIH